MMRYRADPIFFFLFSSDGVAFLAFSPFFAGVFPFETPNRDNPAQLCTVTPPDNDAAMPEVVVKANDPVGSW